MRILALARVGQTTLGIAPDWVLGQLLGVVAFGGAMYAAVTPQVRSELSPAMFLATGVLLMLALNLTVLVHEAGHALVAHASGARVQAVVLMWLGGATVRGAIDSEPLARATAAAGPLANLLAVLVFIVLLVVLNPDRPLADVLLANAAFQALNGLTNLVPFGKLDGARIFGSGAIH
jgi:Zn-dependent protease